MLEDEITGSHSVWPPPPSTQPNNVANTYNKTANDVSQKQLLLRAIVGAAVNFALNFVYMILGDLLWLTIAKKMAPGFQPADSYFGTGTPSFLWIMLGLSLGSSVFILALKHSNSLKMNIAYTSGACLMSCLTITFWLSVENINML